MVILFLLSGVIVTSSPFFKPRKSTIFLFNLISNESPTLPTFVLVPNPHKPFSFVRFVIFFEVSSSKHISPHFWQTSAGKAPILTPYNSYGTFFLTIFLPHSSHFVLVIYN